MELLMLFAIWVWVMMMMVIMIMMLAMLPIILIGGPFCMIRSKKSCSDLNLSVGQKNLAANFQYIKIDVVSGSATNFGDGDVDLQRRERFYFLKVLQITQTLSY